MERRTERIERLSYDLSEDDLRDAVTLWLNERCAIGLPKWAQIQLSADGATVTVEYSRDYGRSHV